MCLVTCNTTGSRIETLPLSQYPQSPAACATHYEAQNRPRDYSMEGIEDQRYASTPGALRSRVLSLVPDTVQIICRNVWRIRPLPSPSAPEKAFIVPGLCLFRDVTTFVPFNSPCVSLPDKTNIVKISSLDRERFVPGSRWTASN